MKNLNNFILEKLIIGKNIIHDNIKKYIRIMMKDINYNEIYDQANSIDDLVDNFNKQNNSEDTAITIFNVPSKYENLLAINIPEYSKDCNLPDIIYKYGNVFIFRGNKIRACIHANIFPPPKNITNNLIKKFKYPKDPPFKIYYVAIYPSSKYYKFIDKQTLILDPNTNKWEY